MIGRVPGSTIHRNCKGHPHGIPPPPPFFPSQTSLCPLTCWNRAFTAVFFKEFPRDTGRRKSTTHQRDEARMDVRTTATAGTAAGGGD